MRRTLAGTKPLLRVDRGLGTNAGHQTFPNSVKYGRVKMTEAVALIMGLFCAGIFVAHAVDAYLAH